MMMFSIRIYLKILNAVINYTTIPFTEIYPSVENIFLLHQIYLHATK